MRSHSRRSAPTSRGQRLHLSTPGTWKPRTTMQCAVIFIKKGRRSVYQFEDEEQWGHDSKAKVQLRAISGEVLGLEDRITTDSGFHWWLFTFYPLKCKKLWYKTLPGQRAPRGWEPWAPDYRIKAGSITQMEANGVSGRSAAHHGACWPQQQHKDSFRGSTF